MQKHIILFFIFTLTVFGVGIKTPLLSIDEATQTATIKVKKIDLGMSGFIVQKLGQENASILKNTTVISYDKNTQIATLKMQEFDQLEQNALPVGKWKVKVGDIAILASGYSRALLIAPNEDIYYRITKATRGVQWIHPDIFVTILSYNGHKTPLKEDFNTVSIAGSFGLVFLYLDKNLFTLDSKSMRVLNISEAPLKQESVKLPFFSRLEEITTDWYHYFDSASKEIPGYEEYYYSFLLENNPKNEKLKELHQQYLKKEIN